MKRRNVALVIFLVIVIIFGIGTSAYSIDSNNLDDSNAYDLNCTGISEITKEFYSKLDYDVIGEQFCLGQYDGTLYKISLGDSIDIFASEDGVKKAVNVYKLSENQLIPLNWDNWFGGYYGLDLINTPDYDPPKNIQMGETFKYTANIGGVYLLVEICTTNSIDAKQYLFYVNEKVEAPVLDMVIAMPSTSTVMVNGELISIDAYYINDNNYFKLRDLAYILNIRNSEKQFGLNWDNEKKSINIVTSENYIPAGGELETGKHTEPQTAVVNSSPIYLNGEKVELAAYTINGNNYFKLRDIASVINFDVDWDGANNTIIIEPFSDYTIED